MNDYFLSIKKLENSVSFGFFTRNGGVSNGLYNSLNCSKNNNDNIQNVNKNIKICLKNLNLDKKKLKLINQQHSNKIYFVKKSNFSNELYGDGLITKDKNLALGILTADCAPIFLFDVNKSIVCCLHSGWKGTLLNIAGKGIKLFKQENISTNNIIAIVGPCLGYNNFEVSKKFKLKFINKNRYYSKFFKTKNIYKDLFNLRGLINFQLKSLGIKKIYNIRKDTYKNDTIFFSHRRSIHKNNINTGRMVNIISLKD